MIVETILLVLFMIGVLLDIFWLIPRIKSEVVAYILTDGKLGIPREIGVIMMFLFPLIWWVLLVWYFGEKVIKWIF